LHHKEAWSDDIHTTTAGPWRLLHLTHEVVLNDQATSVPYWHWNKLGFAVSLLNRQRIYPPPDFFGSCILGFHPIIRHYA
jgi:hypothetical protein